MGIVVLAKFLTYVRDKYVACPPATIAWAHIIWTNYSDVIMSAMALQITSLTIVYSTVYPGTDQRKHQNSASLALVGGIHRWPVNPQHKGPITRKCFHLMTLSWEASFFRSLNNGWLMQAIHSQMLIFLSDVISIHFESTCRNVFQVTYHDHFGIQNHSPGGARRLTWSLRQDLGDRVSYCWQL